MNRTSLIGHVVEIHAAAASARRPADALLAAFFRDRRYLGSRDRRFISEALYGMLRRHRLLAETVRSAGLPSSSLLLYAAYALTGPDAETLAGDITPLLGTAAPDAGTALRALTAADPLRDPTLTPPERLALETSLPDFLVDEWHSRFGPGEAEQLCRSMNQPAPTTARVNTLRISAEECCTALAAEGVRCTRTSLAPAGIRFDRRVSVRSLQTFRRGFFEMQDEGSQLIGLLVEPPPGGFVVDACAGGGGKTLHLAALMGDRGTIAALEVSGRRLGDIRERLARNGVRSVRVLSATEDREEIGSWKGTADAVLVDAPCSGSGTLRRNPGLRLALAPESVEEAGRIQRSVLQTSADLVRRGGRLVYGTCSLLHRENRQVAEEFIRLRPEFALHPVGEILLRQGVDWHDPSPYLELFPHRHGTDGFFAGVFTRVR